jgi:hypothetical protein
MDDLTVGTTNADNAIDSTTAPTTDIFGGDDIAFSVDNGPSDTDTTAESPDTSQRLTLSDGTQVSLDELERGYLRQSDYTRKTQDLSRQRGELAQAEQLLAALEADPRATLDALQRHLIGDVQQDIDLDDLDPVELELREHREFIEQQRATQMQYEIESELAGLAQQYGSFDWGGVLEFAINQEIPDLEAALLLYNKTVEREQARRAGNEQALSAKRNAPPVSGGSRAQGTVSQSVSIDSVMDAWKAAKNELGYE